jgi:phage-related protein
MAWSVKFLNDTVLREFRELPRDIAARFQHIFRLVEEEGPYALHMPNAGYIRDGIWEFRAKGKDGIARGLFVSVIGEKYVVLRFFIKKTPRTPTQEIRLAQKRQLEIPK